MMKGRRGSPSLYVKIFLTTFVVVLMALPSPIASASGPSSAGAGTPGTLLVALPWHLAITTVPGARQLIGQTPSSSVAANIVINLNVQNPAALNNLVNSVSNPNSPYYAHFITEAQFIQMFSPPPSVVQEITTWLAQQGVTVTYVAPDYRSIDAHGTLGALSKAFDISFADYSAPTFGSFYAPTAAPSLPATFASYVMSVAGLSDVKTPMKDDAMRITGFVTPGAIGNGAKTYTPDESFHQIYQLDKLYNSTGNASAGIHPSYAVGVNVAPTLWNDTPGNTAETGPYTYTCQYDTSDINQFFNNTDGYSHILPKVSIQPHYDIPGFVGLAPNVDTCASANNGGGSGEVMMDFEGAGTTAPGANISYTWMSASNNNAAFNAMMNWIASNIQAGAKTHINDVTESWGGAESYDCYQGPCLSTAYETDFAEMAAIGVTSFSSTGDDDGNAGNGGTGTQNCLIGAANPPMPEEPSTLPDNTAVGAVAFTAATLPGTTAGDDKGAQVWNWGCGNYGGTTPMYWVGGTGGLSDLYAKPAWQYGYNVNSSIGFGITSYNANGGAVYSATSARAVPDWSGVGDNVNVYVNGAWSDGWGGTSEASPDTAGLVAEVSEFDGHQFGLINPLIYSLANLNLSGKLPGVPTLPAIEPTYQVQNWSNDATGQTARATQDVIANFHGATNFNLSTGWGLPLAWDFANLAGKPWVATNPEAAPSVGTAYPISATIQDYRAINYANVTYKAPGASTWSNVSLSLASGNTNKGVWTGSIPAAAFTTTGKLQYCVYAIDQMSGNSWSPWNQSGWVVNAHGSNYPWQLFGCDHPFNTTVAAGSGVLNAGAMTLNSTGPGETSFVEGAVATFSGGTSTFTPTWCWGDGTKTTGIPITASPAYATHTYSAAGTFTPRVFINDSAAHTVNMVPGASLTLYTHVAVSAITPSAWGPWTPPANRTFSATPSAGSGGYTYAWNFNDGNTSTVASPPYQIYYKPGTYTVTLTVTDSLSYQAATSLTFQVYGTASTITLAKGQNFIALPTVANSYTLYEISVLAGVAFAGENLLSGSTSTLYDRGADKANGNVAFAGGNALWLNVSAAETITVYGNTTASLAGVPFAADWSSVGWSVSAGTTASALAALISGAMEISIWSTSSGQWATFIVGWDTGGGPHDFSIATGTAVMVWTFGAGTFTE
jgi:hypothetical protein